MSVTAERAETQARGEKREQVPRSPLSLAVQLQQGPRLFPLFSVLVGCAWQKVLTAGSRAVASFLLGFFLFF